MSTSSAVTSQSAPAAQPPVGASSRVWILNSWMDLLLFVSTPLLIVPLVLCLRTAWVGVDVELISLIVSAFGGLGHHLPGMIRAYGDRELFQRFRMRFILAPVCLLAVCIPLSHQRLNAMLLVLSVWGCWHALMQVYGFVRIYDAKVGSIAPMTARWDWLMCVGWFSCGQIFSDGKLSRLLEYWYDSGGPLIPPSLAQGMRWMSLAVCVGVTIGFLVNYLAQLRTPGPQPNPVKLVMLASGIGFWWFAMVYVDQIVLGIALFEAFHDVQYLAIVWLYNCRRVNTAPAVGAFMRFLFRRGQGLLWLYIGLVFAYGYIGIAARPLQNQSLKETINGVVWASTILHFYYDGFIWKIRESATRASLGLSASPSDPAGSRWGWNEVGHILKWCPLVALLTWLTATELAGSSLPQEATERRFWPYATQFERVQNIAAAVPGDLRAQRRAAITLANVGRQGDAIRLLTGLLRRHPDYAEGHQLLGDIYRLRDELAEASQCYRQALRYARSRGEQTLLHHQLGEICLLQNNRAEAEREFRQALQLEPCFEPSLVVLKRMALMPPPRP